MSEHSRGLSSDSCAYVYHKTKELIFDIHVPDCFCLQVEEEEGILAVEALECSINALKR